MGSAPARSDLLLSEQPGGGSWFCLGLDSLELEAGQARATNTFGRCRGGGGLAARRFGQSSPTFKKGWAPAQSRVSANCCSEPHIMFRRPPELLLCRSGVTSMALRWITLPFVHFLDKMLGVDSPCPSRCGTPVGSAAVIVQSTLLASTPLELRRPALVTKLHGT